MEIDTDKMLEHAIRDGMREGIKQKLGQGYNSALDKMVEKVIAEKGDDFHLLLTDALSSALSNSDFRQQIKDAVQNTLARTLVQRFGGELEKQVNVLKSDPATRARITLAIEEIVKAK